ncbi:MAG TPA: replicative DNA helicase [Candidatus Paceibacterota bacterium]|nr:replicative DNA helicase [Candidatus Paceibacterota bacterium]
MARSEGYGASARPSPYTNVRIPPQHTEAEKALLGSILLRSESLYDISDSLSADAFYAEKHRLIYHGMIELAAKRDPIDLLTLSAKLEDKRQLDQIGGRSYLAELAGAVPSSANAKYYAEIIRKKFVMRTLIDAANHISELGYSEERELDQLIDEAEQKIYNISNTAAPQSIVHIKDALAEAWERIEKLHQAGEGLRGVSTGFTSLDNLLSGLQKSDLIILAARPSVGKTSLALDMARRAAVEHGVPVGIFSLEMSAQQLIDRMLAAESSVDSWRLRTGKLNADSEFAYLSEAIDRLSKAPIFINDTPGMNILSMRSAVRRLKAEHKLGLVIVDYLQLMTPLRNSDSMVQQVTEISRSLKGLAKELDIPVLALSQLSRAVEQRGGRPRLSDLRDSGSIEQDADVVMFIHREDRTNEASERKNIAEIMIEKHRNGPTGIVELFFDDRRTTFRDIEKNRKVDTAFDEVF